MGLRSPRPYQPAVFLSPFDLVSTFQEGSKAASGARLGRGGSNTPLEALERLDLGFFRGGGVGAISDLVSLSGVQTTDLAPKLL